MNEVLERLLVTIEGSSELLRQELRKGGTDVDQFARNTDQRLGKVDLTFRKVAATARMVAGVFGVGFGATALLSFTKGAIQAADAVGETAKAAGFGAERFQRLQFVFRQNGVEAGEFDAAMRTANTRLGQFITTGAGPAAKAIEQLGLKQRIANGEIRNGEQFVDAIIDALSKVENSAERAALAAAFFGREAGAKMQETLGLGKEAIDAAAKAASNVFSDETVRQADALGDAWERIALNAGKAAAVQATFDVARLFGVDEAVKQFDSLESQLARLEHTRDMTLANRESGIGSIRSVESLDTEIAAIKAQMEHERLLKLPFITGPATPDAGLSEIKIPDSAIVNGRRTNLRSSELMRDMPIGLFSDQGLSEIKVPDRIQQPADLKQMPDWQSLISRSEEYAKTVEAARERQQRFADTLAATFESRGVAALFSGKPRDAIKGLGQDFAELVIRMAILQPIAEKLAATISGIGFGLGTAGGGGGGFFASLGSIFGFASGGRPPVGRPSWVGEGGKPELFVPDVPGRIYSHAQSMRMAGAGGPSVSIGNIDARGAQDPAAVEAAVERGVRAAVSIADARTDARFRAAMRPAIA